MIRSAVLATALSALLTTTLPVSAQNLFAPRLLVNDEVITEYEVQQRVQMLMLFNAPGDLEAEALRGLTEDRLRLSEAKKYDFKLNPEELREGMEEFASRANLTADQLIEALGQAGVSAETFRDFVKAGLSWREMVRGRFGPQIQITDTEIDRVMAAQTQGLNSRAQLSEIFIPFEAGNESAALSLARSLGPISQTPEAFAANAKLYSKSASSARGGQLNWQNLSEMSPELREQVIAIPPGGVTQPVRLEGGYAIYLLNQIEREPTAETTAKKVDYALLTLPAGAEGTAQAAAIRARYNSCDGLYEAALGLPQDRLQRETRSQAQVPADLVRAIAGLDEGESTVVTRGGNTVVVMLCARLADVANLPERSDIRNRLTNMRLAQQADAWLAEIEAAAHIRKP